MHCAFLLAIIRLQYFRCFLHQQLMQQYQNDTRVCCEKTVRLFLAQERGRCKCKMQRAVCYGSFSRPKSQSHNRTGPNRDRLRSQVKRGYIQFVFRPGPVLALNWFSSGFGLDLVQSGFRPGSVLGQSWVSPGSVLGQS